MKVVRFSLGARVRYGILKGDVVHLIRSDNLLDIDPEAPEYRLEDVRLLAPCQPSKIVALGINYKSHAIEFKKRLAGQPADVPQAATAVIGPDDDIGVSSLFHTGRL
jgi:2-keto-4-pentenoate hydratase/2-oxohepta-3-ene-1,7-dioic acid hydratase in catechol pathway